LNRGGKLQQLLLRYTHVLKDGVGVRRRSACPSTACRQRPCRWLLVTSDCLQSDSLGLAQEHLAIMLGKHRNRISTEPVELKKCGLIDYNRNYDRARSKHHSR